MSGFSLAISIGHDAPHLQLWRGVQSTAALVLTALGEIGPFDAMLFANTGDDSENPATLEYVRTIAAPYAEANGIELIELGRRRRDGSTETLFGRLTRPGSRSLPIPVRMSETGAPGTRSCTADFKISVIDRWLRDHGATADDPAEVSIGISTDEIERARPGPDPRSPRQIRCYPLLDLGLDRLDCHNVIARAGLPIPEKSACWFCPMHALGTWKTMSETRPDLFARAVELEAMLNARRAELGRDPVYFSSRLRPLREAIETGQLTLLDGAGCESGYCFT